MYSTILVAVDGSANGKRAIDAAIELAKCNHALLLLVHVIVEQPLPEEIVEMIAAGEIDEFKSDILTTSAELLLRNARHRCEKAGYTNIQTEYIVGDPARRLLEYAENHDADLLVMGHRGIDSKSDMLGSVVRKLINMTKLTVLIVG